MNTKEKIKFMQIVNNNPTYPILVQNNESFDMENIFSLPTDISDRELHLPTGWHEQLIAKAQAQSDKIYLTIEQIDNLSLKEQQKFIPLLKDRRAGNFKLPDNVQIIISAKNLQNVAQEIKKYALYTGE